MVIQLNKLKPHLLRVVVLWRDVDDSIYVKRWRL